MTKMLGRSIGAILVLAAIVALPAVASAQEEDHGRVSTSSGPVEKRASELRQLSLARSLLQARQWDQAIEAFTKVAMSSNDDLAIAGRAGLSHAFAMKAKSSDHDSVQADVRRLRLGKAFLAAGDWDKAIAEFTEATASRNASIAGDALAGIEAALRDKDTSPLGIRAYLGAPFNRWWPIDYLLYAVAAGVTCLIIAFLWSRSLGRMFEKTLAALLKRPFDWKVTVAGSAQPEQRNAAFDEFVTTMRELRRRRDQSGIPGMGRLRFLAPLSLGDIVGPDLKVQGLDVSRLAAMLQAVFDRYTYQFEIRVETIDSKPYVNAILRWGGQTEKVWQLPSLSDDTSLGYRDIGQQLAFRVYGDSLVRT
ncbi:tetratricopeptide (TPR) repeat protein [Rhizobium sp. BK077]|uniref:tetratricopeptide repeat protein n=1 Tax=unclassified Rhizobium TaxID=2613769 RepID=UPI0016224B15|nr:MULTISPECIES: tetratricopeptide repeat protein [unclassified Rhizobium]MBB3303300.1 tetratricopeptide (TPR) repeat protein [Rhizobium sp. BK112]MBB3372437.1 tetratricopeptide (TPR) repeat protein [Rhizobium sp. BK077]MBB4183158.1 tetratricopeptide (TPR) repeat protein [Rhizobium sp. BK109]